MGTIGWVNKHSINKEQLTVTVFETDSALPINNITDPSDPASKIERATGYRQRARINRTATQRQIKIKAKLVIKIDRDRARMAAEIASEAAFDFSDFESELGD